MCNVCGTFFQAEQKKTAVLEEIVLWWEATPTSLQPASCPTDHTGKWEYQYSILEGVNKELWAARAVHNARPELTINIVRSFNFS